ncbi:MAG TPA: 3-oxoacyl-[acyl-carrier-protein] synthase III C-terminal domain-containing protein [Planctomycetota bacterium]|nr:3-oxoacyl-[acyl-carrier-protein] synthase III C-terminal domain-containing protein [Planctomycetota bacterium]
MKSPSILATRTALPPHVVSQEALLARLLRHWGDRRISPERVAQLHRATGVSKRHLALPMDDYPALDSFPKKNAVWMSAAFALGCEAVTGALAAAGLEPRDVDHIFFTTVTGIAVPSLCARIAGKLGFPAHVKRTPFFGLGCVGGAAGVARAADYLRAFPDEVAIVLSIELCSLTLQLDDFSIANVIATGLFGDGAACVVLAGADGPSRGGPRVTASRSILYPDTEEVMGWELVKSGFKVVLTGRVPDVARENLGRDVESFLGDLGLPRESIRHWVVHTGGPKVLEAIEEGLGLPRSALARSWRSLETVGNLSSASVLFVLHDLLGSDEPKSGERGLLTAMGPGFVSELVVLEW